MLCTRHEVCLLIILHVSWTGGMTEPSNKISNEICFVFSFLPLCLHMREREREINKTTQLCVKSWCKGKIKKNPGVEFQEVSLCHQQVLWPFWALVFDSACTTLAPLSHGGVIKPGYHLSSLITPHEVPKYPSIRDNKMETKGRKYIKNESFHILLFLY